MNKHIQENLQQDSNSCLMGSGRSHSGHQRVWSLGQIYGAAVSLKGLIASILITCAGLMPTPPPNGGSTMAAASGDSVWDMG